MTAIFQQHAGPLGTWRYVLWTALAGILLCPLVASQFTEEVQWGAADYAAGALLLAGLGIAVELAFSLRPRKRDRVLAIGMALTAVLLIWADAAVGIF